MKAMRPSETKLIDFQRICYLLPLFLKRTCQLKIQQNTLGSYIVIFSTRHSSSELALLLVFLEFKSGREKELESLYNWLVDVSKKNLKLN